jgi:hypothetical protein
MMSSILYKTAFLTLIESEKILAGLCSHACDFSTQEAKAEGLQF